MSDIIYDQMTKLLPDDKIEAVWFGDWGDRPNKREIIRDTLAKLSAGYGVGYTARSIVQKLKLAYGFEPTKRGRKYLYWANKYAISMARIYG